MIRVIEGSILDADTDVIVNPANTHLRHTGGLARVIAEAAAPFANPDTYVHPEDRHLIDADLAWQREQANAPLVATGNACVTSAGRLPFKGIIHAVGPVWNGGYYYEAELLEVTHESAFRRAAEHGWKSIAVPAISCGVFGFPVKLAAPIAIQRALSWHLIVPRIDFYVMGDEHRMAYERALAARLTPSDAPGGESPASQQEER